jgi:hypothetical protein
MRIHDSGGSRLLLEWGCPSISGGHPPGVDDGFLVVPWSVNERESAGHLTLRDCG